MTENYVVEYDHRDREIRRYAITLKKTEYSEKKIAATLPVNSSTSLNLWIGHSGQVIGLDFITIEDKK